MKSVYGILAAVSLVAVANAGCAAVSATLQDQMASTISTHDDAAVSQSAASAPQIASVEPQTKSPQKAVEVTPAVGSTMALRVVSMPDASSKSITPRYVYMMEPVASEGDNSSAPLAGVAVKTVVTEDTSQTVTMADNTAVNAPAPQHMGFVKHLYWFLSGR